MLEEGLGEQGEPPRQMRVQELGELLEGVEELDAIVRAGSYTEGCRLHGGVAYIECEIIGLARADA